MKGKIFRSWIKERKDAHLNKVFETACDEILSGKWPGGPLHWLKNFENQFSHLKTTDYYDDFDLDDEDDLFCLTSIFFFHFDDENEKKFKKDYREFRNRRVMRKVYWKR